MLVWQQEHRLAASLPLLQAQAHLDILVNHSSQHMVCLNNQHTDSQDMLIPRRNSKLQHTGNPPTGNQLAMNLLSKVTLKELREWSSKVSRV